MRSRYYRLTNKKRLILPLEKYFKTLIDIIIGTAGALLFELFTIFQSVDEITVLKCGHLMLSRVFAHKFTPDSLVLHEIFTSLERG